MRGKGYTLLRKCILGLNYQGRNREAYEWNLENYVGATGKCPFCSFSTALKMEKPDPFEKNKLWECPECG